MSWIFLAFFSFGVSASLCQNTPIKLIIDTDAGGDDAVAIFLALAATDKVKVIAITCSYGNTDEANVETNLLKILTVVNRTDIPVYRGSKMPLLQNFEAGDYFGKDGLGDFDFGRKIFGTIDGSKHASLAMVELAKNYSGDLSILTLGPLTNVALAASLDPTFTRNVNRFYVMGAMINDSSSTNSNVEFNFGLDPESNAIFLNSSTKLETLISPWDVVLKYNISKEWRTGVLGKLNSEVMTFLNKAEAVVLEKLTEWLPADSIAVATMIWPDLIETTLKARMSSVTCGPLRGSVLVDANGSGDKPKNVEIIRNFNVASFKDKLLYYLA